MSDRQDEIVGTALRLISEDGIQELTMKKIATAIGITEPALYRHFTSKFQILSAVVDTNNGGTLYAIQAINVRWA